MFGFTFSSWEEHCNPSNSVSPPQVSLPAGQAKALWIDPPYDRPLLIEQDVYLKTRPAQVSWGLRWQWDGGRGFVDFALYSGASRQDALVTVAGSRDQRDSACSRTSDGLHCDTLMPFKTGHAYKLIEQVTTQTASKHYWLFAVVDIATNSLTKVATVGLPASVHPSNFSNYEIYSGPYTDDCSSIPISEAQYGGVYEWRNYHASTGRELILGGIYSP